MTWCWMIYPGGPYTAVSYAKSMLAQNATQVQILDEIKGLCDLIPTKVGGGGAG